MSDCVVQCSEHVRHVNGRERRTVEFSFCPFTAVREIMICSFDRNIGGYIPTSFSHLTTVTMHVVNL